MSREGRDMGVINRLNGVTYCFDNLDIIECSCSGGQSDYNGLFKLKKVDVLALMIQQDTQEFNTLVGVNRSVKDILRIRHIIWPSNLSFDDNGAPQWTTNDVDKTFRVHYIVAGPGLVNGHAYMNIDDLPSLIRDMKVDRVLGSKGEVIEGNNVVE